MNSTLTKSQVKTFLSPVYKDRKNVYVALEVEVRYDDRCNNGHNTFSITAQEVRYLKNGSRRALSDTWYSAGCQHDLVAEKLPGLAPLLKWHLMSSDGPIHYIANTVYWAKCANEGSICSKKLTKEQYLDRARNAAIGADLPDSFFAPNIEIQETYPGVEVEVMSYNGLKDRLSARLPQLLADFRKDIESLGFTF